MNKTLTQDATLTAARQFSHSLAVWLGRLIVFEDILKTGEITENPYLGNDSALNTKQSRTKPMNRLACRLIPPECSSMQTRKTHLGKSSISFRNAIEYLARVIGKAPTHRRNVVLKCLVAPHLAAQRASKCKSLCEQLRDGCEVANIPDALTESCNEGWSAHGCCVA